jgi:ABC-type uncharacterized transport system permease subunit
VGASVNKVRMVTGGLIAAFALAELFTVSEPALPSWLNLLLLFIAGVVIGD